MKIVKIQFIILFYFVSSFANSICQEINTDRYSVHRLTNNDINDFGPKLSPDGTLIAFNSLDSNGIPQIFTMRTDGSERTQLTFRKVASRDPEFSPDGQRIVYMSYNPKGLYCFNFQDSVSYPLNIQSDSDHGYFFVSFAPNNEELLVSYRKKMKIMKSI